MAAKSKNGKTGLIFFPAFDWAISPTHPEREERLVEDRGGDAGDEPCRAVEAFVERFGVAAGAVVLAGESSQFSVGFGNRDDLPFRY